MYTMSDPSTTRALSRASGRSILENTVISSVPVDQVTSGQTIRIPDLGAQVMSDLRALYPFMHDNIVTDANCSFEKLVHNFKCDVYPEGEIFWWQIQVLSVLHALNLSSATASTVERPSPPKVDDLFDNVSLVKYLRFPKELRQRVHATVFKLLMGTKEFPMDSAEDGYIIEAINEITDSRREENNRIEEGRLLRYGQVFGARCSACNNIGKGKVPCSRCENVFYCGSECQNAHWPLHKDDCENNESGAARSTKTP